MYRLSIILNIAALIAIAALFRESHTLKKRLADDVLSEHAAEILGDKIVLEQLRQNSATNAMELLEMGIDSGVLLLVNAPKGLDAGVSANLTSTLVAVKRYRERYPRKRESSIDGDEATFEQVRAKVAGTLSHAE